jgi:hypothetical protein
MTRALQSKTKVPFSATHRRASVRRMPKLAALNSHFHIRWLPSDLLDWQPFTTARAADRQAKKMVGKDETYTLELFSASCQRCHSRKYSEPTKILPHPRFLN